MRARLIAASLVVAVLLGGCATQGANKVVDSERAAQANADLGIEYMRQGDYPRALVKLRRALEQDSSLVDAHSGIALLYQQLQEYGEAEVHFKKALALSKSEPNIQNNYAVFLCSQGRHQEALGYFLKVAKNPAYPQPEVAYTNAGVCARRIPDNEQAETHLREALRRNPQFGEALAQMAFITYDQGDYART
ncbi:MAG: type IV pilus biogenesis/stability protein PilW, partial [Nevskiales bacterium]